MPKYESYTPMAAKWLLPDGSITDKMPTSGDGGGSGSSIKIDDTQFQALAKAGKQDEIISAIGSLKIQGIPGILTGDVDPNSGTDYPKLIEPTGAYAIEIQNPKDNTQPLLVSDMDVPFGHWEIAPGTSSTFYYSKLYVSLPDGATEVQKVTFRARKYA